MSATGSDELIQGDSSCTVQALGWSLSRRRVLTVSWNKHIYKYWLCCYIDLIMKQILKHQLHARASPGQSVGEAGQSTQWGRSVSDITEVAERPGASWSFSELVTSKSRWRPTHMYTFCIQKHRSFWPPQQPRFYDFCIWTRCNLKLAT
jgi:hypothetical protein